MDDRPAAPGLEEATRRLDAEHRLASREVEAAVEDSERAQSSLADAVLELMYRGDRVRVLSCGRSWTGQVFHLGVDFLALVTPSGARIDIRFEAVDHVEVEAANAFPGRGLHDRDPQSFIARLRELAVVAESATVGGRHEVSEFVVETVAPDHLAGTAPDGRRRLIPISAIGFVVADPSVGRSGPETVAG